MTYASDAYQLAEARRLVRGVLAKRQPDAIYRRLRASETHLAECVDYLRGRAESQSRGGAGGRWYVHATALAAWRRLTRQTGTDDRLRAALLDACEAATLRATDSEGRELWRTPKHTGGGLRMVVDPDAGEREGDLPVLLWVGQSRPPTWCWSDENRAAQVPSGRRER